MSAGIFYVLTVLTWYQIRFLGGKLGKALAEEFEASTVGDLLLVEIFSALNLCDWLSEAPSPWVCVYCTGPFHTYNMVLDDLQRKFGEESIWVYEILR